MMVQRVEIVVSIQASLIVVAGNRSAVKVKHKKKYSSLRSKLEQWNFSRINKKKDFHLNRVSHLTIDLASISYFLSYCNRVCVCVNTFIIFIFELEKSLFFHNDCIYSGPFRSSVLQWKEMNKLNLGSNYVSMWQMVDWRMIFLIKICSVQMFEILIYLPSDHRSWPDNEQEEGKRESSSLP